MAACVPWIRPHTTSNVNGGEDHEDGQGHDLCEAEPVLDLAVDPGPSETNEDEGEEKGSHDPFGPQVGAPIAQLGGDGGELERQHDQPVEHKVPAHGEAPGWADEAHAVVVEGPLHGIRRSELPEPRHGRRHHQPHEREAQYHRPGPARRQRLPGSHEQARPDRPAQRKQDHVPVANVSPQVRAVGVDPGAADCLDSPLDLTLGSYGTGHLGSPWDGEGAVVSGVRHRNGNE